MLRSLIVLVVLVVVTAPVEARDIYVNNVAGDDTSTGHQAANMPDRSGPVRSIAKALRLAQQGDRIILANTGEPYRESISLVGSRHSGLSFNRFAILGNGAVLDGSAPVPAHQWEQFRGPIFRFRPPLSAYQQLFLGDRPATRVVLRQLTDAPPELDPGQWCLAGGWIYFCVELRKLPEDYPLSYAAQRVGITLFHVSRVVISDLTVQGFQLDGINASNSARDVMLHRVTCRGNGRYGISVGGASLLDIGASLAGDNGVAQVRVEPCSELHVHDTQLLSNTGPGLANAGGRVYLEGKPLAGGIDGK